MRSLEMAWLVLPARQHLSSALSLTGGSITNVNKTWARIRSKVWHTNTPSTFHDRQNPQTSSHLPSASPQPRGAGGRPHVRVGCAHCHQHRTKRLWLDDATALFGDRQRSRSTCRNARKRFPCSPPPNDRTKLSTDRRELRRDIPRKGGHLRSIRNPCAGQVISSSVTIVHFLSLWQKNSKGLRLQGRSVFRASEVFLCIVI